MRRNKFGAVKTNIDGLTFDSKIEGRRYQELKLLVRSGEISNLQLQPIFVLQPEFSSNGKKIRPIYYIADFLYLDKDGNAVVEDVKGVKTKDYQIKRKMFLYLYPEMKHIEVTREQVR